MNETRRRSAGLAIAASASASASLLLLGCSASGPSSSEATAVSRGAIVGGALESGHPAVAGILAFDLQTFCSGTLIAPRTLLTAGHCANAASSLTTYYAVFGADDSGTGIEILRQVTHPGFTAAGKPFDFAVFELKSAPPAVAPFPFARRALPGLHAGTPITHVGFGATSDSQLLPDGKKRVVTTPITRIDPTWVYSGNAVANTCNGDSGGPGTIVGTDGNDILVSVISDGPSCTVEGWDGRVDVVADWIRTTALMWEPSFPAEPNPPPPDAGAPDAAPDATSPPPAPPPSAAADAGPSAEPDASVPPTDDAPAPGGASGCATSASGDARTPAWTSLAMLGLVAILQRRRARRRTLVVAPPGTT